MCFDHAETTLRVFWLGSHIETKCGFGDAAELQAPLCLPRAPPLPIQKKKDNNFDSVTTYLV